MIGKSIRMNRRQRRAVARRLERVRNSIFALTRYVVDADPYGLLEGAADEILSISDYALAVNNAGVEPGEKVEACGTRNLAGRDLGEWQAEMLAVAARATEVRNPLLHIILSLRADETWTEAQREEAITIVLEVLGLRRCQVIWAEHSNTSHPHLHLSVLRVDPVTARAAGTRWVIDDLHQAMAIIEERQERVREPHALYVASGGAVFDVETNALVRAADGTYISDWYKAVGKKRTWLPVELVRSRAALVQAAADSRTWSELHDAFREHDANYDKAGSGAKIGVGHATAKASEVHSSLSRPKLEERLGSFEPDMMRVDHAYEAYRAAFQQQLDHLRKRREEECASLGRWLTAQLAELTAEEAKLIAHAVRKEAEEAATALQKVFSDAIKLCTDQRLTKEKWEAAGRPKQPQRASVPAIIFPSNADLRENKWQPGAAFARHRTPWGAEYRNGGGTIVFTDRRALIIVHATKSAEAIDAALRIAHERWGTVRLTGPAHFIELASARAAAMGINVVDADGFSFGGRPPDVSAPKVTVERNSERFQIPPKARADFSENDVQRALDYLSALPLLPIRRRQLANDDEHGRTGAFEFVMDLNHPHRKHAASQDDPQVQQALQKKYNDMISSWETQILERCPERLPVDSEEVLEFVPAGRSREFARLAYADTDFLRMLERIDWLLYDRRKARAVRQAQAGVTTQALGRDNSEDKELEAARIVQNQFDQLRERGR